MTLILSICGLFLELLILSEIPIPGFADHYNGVRMLLWLGISGSSVRTFLQTRRLQTSIGNYQKQTVKYSEKLAKLTQEREKFLKLESELSQLNAQVWEQKKHTDQIEHESLIIKQELEKSQERTRKLTHTIESKDQNSGDASAIMLLSSLQSKGRFLDFIMNEISQYPDEQVGAAARIVHQGCFETIEQYFDIQPIHQDQEGTTIELDSNSPSNQYRIHGARSENLPSSAKLIHKGWKTSKVSLPKFTSKDEAARLILAPAEIQI